MLSHRHFTQETKSELKLEPKIALNLQLVAKHVTNEPLEFNCLNTGKDDREIRGRPLQRSGWLRKGQHVVENLGSPGKYIDRYFKDAAPNLAISRDEPGTPDHRVPGGLPETTPCEACRKGRGREQVQRALEQPIRMALEQSTPMALEPVQRRREHRDEWQIR